VAVSVWWGHGVCHEEIRHGSVVEKAGKNGENFVRVGCATRPESSPKMG